jgi:hypothetical protein
VALTVAGIPHAAALFDAFEMQPLAPPPPRWRSSFTGFARSGFDNRSMNPIAPAPSAVSRLRKIVKKVRFALAAN